MEIKEDYNNISQQALIKTQELETEIKNLYNKINALIIPQVDVLYDHKSEDASVNWGYVNGISHNTTVYNKDFSPYSKLIVYYNFGYDHDCYGGTVMVDLKHGINDVYRNFNLVYEGFENALYVAQAWATVSIDKKSILLKFEKRWVSNYADNKGYVYKIEGIKI